MGNADSSRLAPVPSYVKPLCVNSDRFETFARAAMLGLLAATQPACDDMNGSIADGLGGTPGDSDGGSAELGGGGQAGPGGATAVTQGVLNSKIIPDLSLDEFTQMCDESGGVVETHAHCGGLVTGPGFSYDTGTDEFTEHTCAGFNTCTGFSCIIDDDS